MKKEVSINGKIVFPLQEGARAVISTGGGLTYTSLVVEIIENRCRREESSRKVACS